MILEGTMRTRILVKTPKGQASKTEKKIRMFILGMQKAHNIYVNEEDTEFVWEIETNVRKTMKIHRNVCRYEQMMKGVLDHKLMKKTLRQKLKPEDEEMLKDMLLKQTEVVIVKNATAEEIVEGNMTWWQRVKTTFKKKKGD